MVIEMQRNIAGSILDIGGGGEGMIGRIYGNQVIAIDNRQEELDEAPDCCEKRLMDATQLLFPDQSFDHATFFYSLMYMTRDVQAEAIREAARVLKRGGRIHIWDSDIASVGREPYAVDLDIIWDGNCVHTSYGIVKGETQSSTDVMRILRECGFQPERHVLTENHFFICGCKDQTVDR
ncbi:MAG: class I SAM-dependent methyltransferase [Bacillota bacterium]|nr:class I SAM-dependent methyltransferase [Bacillota bacterium]